MIVCVCHRVSDHTIVREVRAGCASFDELQDTLRVATACGACSDCAREVFARACGAPDRPPCAGAQPIGRRVVPLVQASAA